MDPLREPMSSVDAAWFRMDRPGNAADVVGLLGFKRLPSIETWRNILRERFLTYRRFRQRVVPHGLGFAWEEVPGFDPESHLREETLATGSRAALERVVSRIATEPLDQTRPLWRMHLVRQPRGGALVLKVSHCVADGFALVAILLSVADHLPEPPDPRHTLPAAKRLEPWIDPLGTARAALGDPARFLDLGKAAGGLALATARLAALTSDPPTSLSRPPTGRRLTAWSKALPHDALRKVARAAMATTNEMLLAALAGALKGHLDAVGDDTHGRELRALVPMNLRPGLPDIRNGPLGNRFGLFFLDLPIGVTDPLERLALVRARMAKVRERPDAVATWMLLGAVGALPGVEDPALRFFARKASLVVTSVPGPRQRLTVGGEPLDHGVFWVPHPSTLGLGVSVLSYAGAIRVGVRADEAVLARPGTLVKRFEAEVQRFLAPRA